MLSTKIVNVNKNVNEKMCINREVCILLRHNYEPNESQGEGGLEEENGRLWMKFGHCIEKSQCTWPINGVTASWIFIICNLD